MGRKQIAESQGQLVGRGMATAGIVLGIIVLALAVIYWVLFSVGAFDEIIKNLETNQAASE
jgi:uncharacterized membrane protein YwzB